MFRDCKTVMYTDDSSNFPSFFAYKCNHESSVIYTTKYFAKRNNPSNIYVTEIPVFCLNKQLIAPKVSYKDAYEYYEQRISSISDKKEIDGKKIIRYVTKYFIQSF